MRWKMDWTAMIFLAMMMATMPIFGKAGGPELKSSIFYNKYGTPTSLVDGYGYANISCQTNGTTFCNVNSPMKLTYGDGNEGIANGICNDGVTTFTLPINSTKFGGVYKCWDAGETCEALTLRYRTCIKTDKHTCKDGEYCFVKMGSDGREQFACSIDIETCKEQHNSMETFRMFVCGTSDRSMCETIHYKVGKITSEQSVKCSDSLALTMDGKDLYALQPIRIKHDDQAAAIFKMRCNRNESWLGLNCSLARSDGRRMFSMDLINASCGDPPFVDLAQWNIWKTVDTYELVCHLRKTSTDDHARLSVVLVVIEHLSVRIVSEDTSTWSDKFVTCEHDRIPDDFVSECEIELPSGNREEATRKEITTSGEYRCVCRIFYASKTPWNRTFATTFTSEPVTIEVAPIGLGILVLIVIALILLLIVLIGVAYLGYQHLVEMRWQRKLEAKEAMKKDDLVKLEIIIQNLANQTAEPQNDRTPEPKAFADTGKPLVGWSTSEFKTRRDECASWESKKQTDYINKVLPQNVIAAPDPKIRTFTVEGGGIPGEKSPTIRADTSVPLDGDPSNRRSWNGNTCTGFYGDTIFVGYVPPKAKEAAFLKALVMQKSVGLIGIFGMCSAFWSPNPKGFKKVGDMFVKTVSTKHDRGADLFILHIGPLALSKEDISFKEICLIFVPYPNDGRAITQTAYVVALEKMLQMHPYQAERGLANVAFLGKSGYPDGEMASVVFQTAQAFLHTSTVPLFGTIARLRQSRFGAYSNKYDKYKLFLGTFNVMDEFLKMHMTKRAEIELKRLKTNVSKIGSKKAGR